MYLYRLPAPLARDVRHYGGLSFWLFFRFVPTVVLLTLSFLFLLSAPVGASEEEVFTDLQSGQMMLRPVGGHYSPAVVQGSRVHFAIRGMIATVVLEQRFSNNSQDFVEGVYAFPLPETAAVRRMEMRVGERRVIGKIREREEARAIYQQARLAGKKTSLVEQQRPNLFTNRIANIAPGESITVELEYVQRIEYLGGLFSLRFPSTITPRFMPGKPMVSPEVMGSYQLDGVHGWALPTDEVPDAHLISPYLLPVRGSDEWPQNSIEISATLDPGMPLASVESPYHEVALSRRAGIYEVSLSSGRVEMDRDFLLQWQPVSDSAPSAALFSEKVNGEYYGLLMMVPPAPERKSKPLPREVVFVIDTSGSMGGESIRQARESLAQALGQLRPEDSFNIIEFNSSHRALYRQAMPATSHHLQVASEFVRHLDATGGTNMLPALRAALQQDERDQHRERAPLRQVIFITDGAVGNEDALFGEISQMLGRSRLFTVGIGSAPNSWFMRKAAQLGGGTFSYIGDVREVGDSMSALFGQLSRPAAVQLSVAWPDGAEVWPAKIPDLYQGEPLLLAVKFGAQLPDEALAVSGRLRDRDWSTRLQVGTASGVDHGAGHGGVASIWARQKIAGLLDEKNRDKTPDEVRAAVLPLAIEHQLLSPYTSFVAVEEVISRPEGEDVSSHPVPNSPPRGQASQPYAYPRTATTARANIWLASFLVLAVIVLRITRGEGADDV